MNRRELGELHDKVELFLKLHRYESAEKLLKVTLAEWGPLANIYNLLGVTFHSQSRFMEAVLQFKQALNTNPEFLEAGLNLAATLCDLSRYEEAQKVFESLQTQKRSGGKQQGRLLRGRLANRHVTSGDSYRVNNMLSEATGEYRKALALYDDMPDVRFKLACLYDQLGQKDKALDEFEELCRRTPDHGEGRTRLGVLYFKLNRSDEARRQWERARDINPDNGAAKAYLRFSAS